jgi:uncharacterized membrane protein YesL
MGGVRFVLKGLHDTFEHLLIFTLVTLVWWVGVLPIVTAPAATIALFAQTDPRLGTQLERRTFGEEFAFARKRFWRGWGIALMTAPLLIVLVINLVTMRPGDNKFGVLAPVWLFLLLIASFVAMTAFSGVALLDLPATEAVRRGALLTAAHVPQVLVAGLLLGVVILVSAALVVPLFMFVPATVAATINRFVLNAYRIEVIDPLSPTEERRREEAARKASRFGP